MHEGIQFAARASRVDCDETPKCLCAGRKMGNLAAIYLDDLAVDLHINAAIFANLVQGLEGSLVILIDYTSFAVCSGQDKH